MHFEIVNAANHTEYLILKVYAHPVGEWKYPSALYVPSGDMGQRS